MTPEIEPDVDPLLGTVIDGKYRIDALLGEGGMGSVYRVQHLGLRRDLALKVLRRDLTSHTEVAARFDREAQSAARLDHPNCMQVTDFGTTDDGLKYMVMQLLAGHELTDELEDGALSPERAVSLMLQIARGLEHAHEHGIVHRDIKPENVFVTTDHEDRELLKLVDFGLAKVLEGELESSSPKLTKVGMVFGTPRYMSPEQAAGGEIDHRSDLYSAGIVFYEMLAGAVPFDSDDLVKVLRQQIVEPPPPLPGHVPEPLRTIVDRLLAKEREDRLESATALVKALEAYQAHQAASTGSHPTGPTLGATASQSMAASQPSVPPVGSAAVTMGPAPVSPTRGSETTPSLPTLLPTAPPPRTGLARRPPWAIVGAGLGGVLALVATCAWMFGGSEPEPSPGAPVEAAWYEGLWAASNGPDDDALAAIDGAIVANRLEEAEAQLAQLEQEHPEHPQLQWRRARLLAKDDASRDDALATYGTAAERAPALLEDPAFFSELDRLLHDPKLEAQAVQVAVDQLGHAGHRFLLERLNDLDEPLPWAERQRAAQAVMEHEECAPLLDLRRQVAQDLLQASEADDTCAVFGGALMKMKLDPDETYVRPAHDAKLPRGCKQHKSLLAEVRAALTERHGSPKGGKDKGRCRGFRGMFRSGC